jgi:hypothetical protein
MVRFVDWVFLVFVLKLKSVGESILLLCIMLSNRLSCTSLFSSVYDSSENSPKSFSWVFCAKFLYLAAWYSTGLLGFSLISAVWTLQSLNCEPPALTIPPNYFGSSLLPLGLISSLIKSVDRLCMTLKLKVE